MLKNYNTMQQLLKVITDNEYYVYKRTFCDGAFYSISYYNSEHNKLHSSLVSEDGEDIPTVTWYEKNKIYKKKWYYNGVKHRVSPSCESSKGKSESSDKPAYITYYYNGGIESER